MTDKVLCVDDDANILEAYKRELRKQFHIDTALGVEQAVSAIQTQGPYAVIVSDLRMPGMDGIQLLTMARQLAPDTVRMILTGFADVEAAIEAVNEGNIFRFLTKPCPPKVLAKALASGVEQYRLTTAEKELLEKTLSGSVKVLTDVLALTNPTAFGRASRVRRLVRKLCKERGVDNSWQFEVAAMLSQIGCVTLPPDTLDKLYHAQRLTADELRMRDTLPSIGRDLVVNIPRLEGVAEIIAYQEKCFDGTGPPPDSTMGCKIPLGARILKLALDYDTLAWGGLKEVDAVMELRKHANRYDPDILVALEASIGRGASFEVRKVGVKDLTTNMAMAEDVTTINGLLVVTKGQEVTPSLCQRLKNFAAKSQIEEPIRVLVRTRIDPRRRPAIGDPAIELETVK